MRCLALVIAVLFMRGRGGPPRDEVSYHDNEAAEERAWRIHDALSGWTGRVDAKASFVLTLVSALLAGVAALFGQERQFSTLNSPWATGFVVGGVVSLALGALAAVSVVAPRLRWSALRGEARENYIYFGHLRDWQPDSLERRLLGGDPLPVLSRQLVAMSRIAWRKHVLVGISCWLVVGGTALVALAAYVNTYTQSSC